MGVSGTKCCQSQGGAMAAAEVTGSPDDEQFDIFFSHKQSEAQDAASAIIGELKLKRPGMKIWLDMEQTPTEQGMESGVKNSKGFLFFCTENIAFSKYCIKELTWALEYQKIIILVAETDPRHGAPEIGVLRDRMPDHLKQVFDENVAIPFYRDPAHKDVSIQKILDLLDGKSSSKGHGANSNGQSPAARLPVKIAAVATGFPDATPAIDNAWRKLDKELGGKKPSLVICNFTCTYNANKIHEELYKRCGSKKAVLGCTSSAGVMVNQTWQSYGNSGLGLWGIFDPDGVYVVGHATDIKETADACRAAVFKADCPSLPDFVIAFPHPGCEEFVLAELKKALGDDVPVVGGSSADNSVAGEWKQFSGAFSDSAQGVTSAGFVFALCWPSVLVHAGFGSGFHPTEHKGKVTKLLGPRHIATIDGEKAALVYDRWSAGTFTKLLKETGDSNILGPSTLTPLGLQQGVDTDGEPMYVVVHPHLIKKEDMSLTTFKDVPLGAELVCLAGTRSGLVMRVSKVAKTLLATAPFRIEDVLGSYQIFCGGVMMCIKDDMHVVAEKLGEVLNWTPSMGACTFGEQGTFLDGSTGHGNLMFASIVFSRIKKSSTWVADNSIPFNRRQSVE